MSNEEVLLSTGSVIPLRVPLLQTRILFLVVKRCLLKYPIMSFYLDSQVSVHTEKSTLTT